MCRYCGMIILNLYTINIYIKDELPLCQKDNLAVDSMTQYDLLWVS